MVVAVERVAGAFESAGSALDGDTVVLAGFAGAELGQIVEVEVDVVGDEEIGPAVGVVVAKGGTGGPGVVGRETGWRGDVGEGAVTVVAVEDDAAEAGDEQVRPAIVVVVSDDCTHGPAGRADAGGIGDVGEGAIVIVTVESAFGWFSSEGHGDAGGVGEVDIGPAVAVEVDEGDTAAHGFDDVALLGRGEVAEVNTGGGGDVLELGKGGGGWHRLGVEQGRKHGQCEQTRDAAQASETCHFPAPIGRVARAWSGRHRAACL